MANGNRLYLLFQSELFKMPVRSESWCAACVGFANWWESSLSASLDPGHGEESQQGSKDIGTLLGLVLVFRVGSWATEGVRKALIHPSGPQARHGVGVMFLHGTLSPESP